MMRSATFWAGTTTKAKAALTKLVAPRLALDHPRCLLELRTTHNNNNNNSSSLLSSKGQRIIIVVRPYRTLLFQRFWFLAVIIICRVCTWDADENASFLFSILQEEKRSSPTTCVVGRRRTDKTPTLNTLRYHRVNQPHKISQGKFRQTLINWC